MRKIALILAAAVLLAAALTACARYFNTEHREYKSTEHNLAVVRALMNNTGDGSLC